jgi:hypothetical protein
MMLDCFLDAAENPLLHRALPKPSCLARREACSETFELAAHKLL